MIYTNGVKLWVYPIRTSWFLPSHLQKSITFMHTLYHLLHYKGQVVHDLYTTGMKNYQEYIKEVSMLSRQKEGCRDR